jgi:flavorubredoxin
MKTITIIYHSLTGHNEAMAKAVAQGAVESGAQANLKKASEATAQDVLNCDAVVFGSPNYFNYMAGAIQIVLEKVFVELAENEITKPYAVFSCGGSMGGDKPIEIIEKICDSFGGKFGKFKFKRVAESISATQEPSPEILERCRELGKKIALS